MAAISRTEPAPGTDRLASGMRLTGRIATAPAVALLLVWMIVPLALTLYFSVLRYRLLIPRAPFFVGLENFARFVMDPAFAAAIGNTLLLVGSVLALTVALGLPLALLLNRRVAGLALVRMLVFAPFLVMPTVSALVWKNLLMHPVSGLLAWLARSVEATPVDWFSDAPLLAIIVIVTWQWLPFAALIFLTALQSRDLEQLDAARMDGAGALGCFRHVTLPHLARPITIVLLIETIFLLAVFAEILVTTAGGPGNATTNLAFLIYSSAMLRFDVGLASAGGIIAVLVANAIAFLLVRVVGRNIDA